MYTNSAHRIPHVIEVQLRQFAVTAGSMKLMLIQVVD
jgi:hypothetical protein